MLFYLDLLVRNETQCEGLKGQVYGEDETSVTLQDQNMYTRITESQMGSGVTTVADIQSYIQYHFFYFFTFFTN